jgi:uncharacterized protein with PIN domain
VPHKFIVDNNVGRLATWLRAMGYDTLFINPIEDGDLVRIAKDEGRIILTKDQCIFERTVVASGAVKAVFVEGWDWKHQLKHVASTLNLHDASAFTRCLECNSPVEPIKRAELPPESFVPADILASSQPLLHCPKCNKIYWPGGHYQRMKAQIREALA